ncbi:MAG TPA: haloacid dehalogenase type II [Kofleriaceae bacterium]|nr:haloacid dehalogenase type II [Kofleriaceae bacterium]
MTRYRLVVFDLYGTLLDVSGMAERMSFVLGRDAGALLAQWRTAQLERTWELNKLGTYEPWDQVTAWAFDRVVATRGEQVPAETRIRMIDEWLSVPAHADAGDTLRKLRAAGVRVAVLSNGTLPMIALAISEAKLNLDEVLSVDAVRVYKPDPRVYGLLDALAPKGEQLFVSSNAFDAEGAKRAGLTVAFVDRGNAQPAVEPDYRVGSLSALLAIVEV